MDKKYVLGINCAYHESAVCLLENGVVVAAVEEERFNRVKHAKKARVDNPDEIPWKSIEFCLGEAGIALEDVHYAGYSLNPKKRFERNIMHKHPYNPPDNEFGTAEGERLFCERALEAEQKLRKRGFAGKFYFLDHHDCHAASAFFPSGFEKAGVLVVDGIGEFESTSLYSGEQNKIRKIRGIEYPHSLGFLWEKISKFLGFSEYDAAKVMGLSTYGNPTKYKDEIRKLISDEFEINDELIKFRTEDYSELEELFGMKRRTEPIRNIDMETKEYADVAAALQEITGEIVLSLALQLREFPYLCMAGGVALNCVNNGKIIESGIFKDVFIQPAANDAGTAIGAAYLIWNQLLDNPRAKASGSPYLGPAFSDEEIEQALKGKNLTYIKPENLEKEVAELIAGGKIVAWFQGRMEIGPRALGNRSILADPRNRGSVVRLNHKVKFREPFRPFCPSILEERADEWFAVKEKMEKPYSYMLSTSRAKANKRKLIPAVMHIDGTSRIQAVKKDLNPRYHKVISEFYRITGVPMVLNTSFNSREPIVCSPEDAISTFLSTKIDYLAIGDFLVSKIPDITLKEYFERLR